MNTKELIKRIDEIKRLKYAKKYSELSNEIDSFVKVLNKNRVYFPSEQVLRLHDCGLDIWNQFINKISDGTKCDLFIRICANSKDRKAFKLLFNHIKLDNLYLKPINKDVYNQITADNESNNRHLVNKDFKTYNNYEQENIDIIIFLTIITSLKQLDINCEYRKSTNFINIFSKCCNYSNVLNKVSLIDYKTESIYLTGNDTVIPLLLTYSYKSGRSDMAKGIFENFGITLHKYTQEELVDTLGDEKILIDVISERLCSCFIYSYPLSDCSIDSFEIENFKSTDIQPFLDTLNDLIKRGLIEYEDVLVIRMSILHLLKAQLEISEYGDNDDYYNFANFLSNIIDSDTELYYDIAKTNNTEINYINFRKKPFKDCYTKSLIYLLHYPEDYQVLKNNRN